MAFQKGDPKPEGSGRKKGKRNESKTRFARILREHGCDLEYALAKAVIEENVELIKALTPLVAFLTPKPRSEDGKLANGLDPSAPAPKPTTPEGRLALIRGRYKSS